MQTKRRELFTTIRTEGAILPADLLQRVANGDSGLEAFAERRGGSSPGSEGP